MNLLYKFFYYFITLLLVILTACSEPETEPETEEQAPEILILGSNPLKTGIYASFVDDSVQILSASGLLDSAWSIRNVDTSLLGKYTVDYYARSLSGLEATAQRDVWVVATPVSMADSGWQVKLVPEQGEVSYFNDTLITGSNKIEIKNFHNIPGAKIKLDLISDLNDVVSISKQDVDSATTVEGKGRIDDKTLLMLLNYSFISSKDTVFYQAVYTRDSIRTTR